MKRISIIFLMFSFCASGQIMWQFNRDTVITWHYADGDEFNGNTIDLNYWTYVLWARSLYMNYEQEYYTEGKNHQIGNGTLKLIAKREPVFAKTIDSKPENDSLFSGKKFISLNKTNFSFTSGKLSTRKEYNKGFFECRFKVPSTGGFWPAFWLHGGDPNEEVDIMESQTSRPSDVHVDTHCPNHCDMVWRNIARESFGAWIKTKINMCDAYNIMACEWNENEVKFYLNGEFIAISKVKFDIPKHLVVNLAVPSDKGPFGPGPGTTDTTGIFEIDYVRVWSNEKKSPGKPQSLKLNSLTMDREKAPLASTVLQKTGRSFYGKKKEAKKEGIKISFFNEKDQAQFTVLGNTLGELPQLSIHAIDYNFSYSSALDKVFNEMPDGILRAGRYEVSITWNHKVASTIFTVD